MDELNKEQELLRNQLATSNIQRSQVESKLNLTIVQLEDKTKQNEKQHVEMIEKIAKISELEGNISQIELALNAANSQVSSLENKLNQTESSKNKTHNEASKDCFRKKMTLKSHSAETFDVFEEKKTVHYNHSIKCF